jgi:hypothetical protein
MPEFVYVLSYYGWSVGPTDSQVRIFVQSHRDIETWYYPFAGTYIFKSKRHITDLAVQFRQFFGGSPFLLTCGTPSLMGGALPQNAWDWLNNVPVPELDGPK